MLRETFIGRNPSHFIYNKFVEAFILSEVFLWSAWNFVTPIFGIFVVNNIKGGDIQIAAFAYSTYLIVRLVMEIIIGGYLNEKTDYQKLTITSLGIIILSLGYVGFSFTSSISFLFLFYVVLGIGMGLATPAKNSLFSTHLDKHKETTEWGIYDGITLLGIALATALGGFIAGIYGFKPLFLLAFVINSIGVIPYLMILRRKAFPLPTPLREEPEQ